MLEDSEKLQEEKKNRQALESELQKQIEERKENEALFADAMAKLTQQTKANERLRARLQTCEEVRAHAEVEEEGMLKMIAEYETWKAGHDKRMEEMAQTSREAVAALKAIKNVMSSLTQRPELSEAVRSFEGFREDDRDILTFSDLQIWMEGMDRGIRDALSVYTEALQKLQELTI